MRGPKYDPYIVYDPPEEIILFRSITRPLAKKLKTINWITPNKITMLDFIILIIAGLFFYAGGYTFTIIGAVLLYISFFLDKLNGDLSRERKQASRFGAYIDGITDHIGDAYIFIMIFAGLGFRNDLIPFVLISIVSHLMFYYNHVATILYLREGYFPRPKPIHNIIAYNRARHILVIVTFSFLNLIHCIYYIFSFLGIYVGVSIIKNVINILKRRD